MMNSGKSMIGMTLIWIALALLAYVAGSDGELAVVAAVASFLSFAYGLSLFVEGLRRDLLDHMQRDLYEQEGNDI